MKKALKFGAIGLGVLILIVVAGAYAIPSEVSLERSVVVDAPPAGVYPHVSSFQNFNAWSPWAKIDPNAKYEFTGPESGVGSTMSWTSDHPNVGNGRDNGNRLARRGKPRLLHLLLHASERRIWQRFRTHLEFGHPSVRRDIERRRQCAGQFGRSSKLLSVAVRHEPFLTPQVPLHNRLAINPGHLDRRQLERHD